MPRDTQGGSCGGGGFGVALGLLGALVPDEPGSPKVVILFVAACGRVPGAVRGASEWVENRTPLAKADVEVSAVALIATAAAVASIVLNVVMTVSCWV